MDPEFKARFDTRRDAAIRIAKFSAGGAADKVASILSQPASEFRDAQLADAIKDFSDSTKAKIMAVNGQLSALDVERQIELESRKATWDQRMQREQQLQQAQSREREQQMRTTFKKELQRWQDPDNGMPFTIPNDANNKEVTAIATRAEDILFGRIKDDAEFAAIGLKAATFDHVIRYAAQLADDYATLRANYDRVMGAQPSDSSYAGPANAGPGHGAAAPEANGNAPLLMSDPAGFAQQLTARRQADATRGAYRG
jgi:hypothetical protein